MTSGIWCYELVGEICLIGNPHRVADLRLGFDIGLKCCRVLYHLCIFDICNCHKPHTLHVGMTLHQSSIFVAILVFVESEEGFEQCW
jgi:hypothetical protein